MLKLWEMRSTPSLPSLWPEVVAPDRVLFTGQIELNCKTELFEMEQFLTLKLYLY